jgi:hypothetical protein
MIDELKLGVLDHDVPIGGGHSKCCIDVNRNLLFSAPEFLD